VDTSVEVRYAGVVVGRGLVLRDQGAEGSFVGIPEPLPVGTRVTLKIGDALRDAQVAEVVESAEPSAVGMRLRWQDAATDARPAPRPAPAPAPVAAAPAPAPAPVAAAPAPAPAPVVNEAPPVAAAPVAAPAPAAAEAPIPAPLSLAEGSGKRRKKRR
jgi:2-oxoglutarate dehydrogenase E2 component (dihydrolipoamide succinyltransferase)